MKTKINNLIMKSTIVLILLLITSSINAQTTKEDKKSAKANDSVAALIAGKWKLENFSMSKEVPPDIKVTMDSMMVIMKQNSIFDFDKSGKFEFKMMDKDSKGTWRVGFGGTILYTKEEGRGDDKCIISKLTSNLFSFQIEQDGDMSTFTLKR